jgi:hypothetical protein
MLVNETHVTHLHLSIPHMHASYFPRPQRKMLACNVSFIKLPHACKLFPQRNMLACNVSFSEGKLAFACTQAPKKLLRKGNIWQAYNKLLHSLPLHQKHIPALSKTLGNKTNKIILHLLAQSKTQRGEIAPKETRLTNKNTIRHPYKTHCQKVSPYKTKILTLKTLTHGNFAA